MKYVRGLSGKWRALLFLATSYYEYAVVGLATVYFVTTSSSEIVGDSSITFLTISYGVFFALGIHNVIVRDGSLSDADLDKKRQLIKVEILFTAFVCFLVLALILFSTNKWFSYGLLIVAGNQLKLAAQTVSRITKNDLALNKLNLVWPTLFLFTIAFLQFSSIPTDRAFFCSWGAALLIVSAPILLSLFRTNCLSIYVSHDDFVVLKQLLHKSKWFVVSMFATTLYVSSDRLFLNLFDYSPNFISVFQISDVISGVFFIGASTLLYYFTPDLLIKFSSGVPRVVLLKVFVKYFTLTALFAISFFFIVLAFHKLTDFGRDFYMILAFMLLLKSSIIGYGVIGNFLMARSEERLLAYVNILLMLCSVFFTFLLIYFDLAMFVPFTIFIVVILFTFSLLFWIVGRNEKNSDCF